jgi:hypothetical protein
LSNDRNKYYFTEEYELVGAGNPSSAAVPPPPPPPPTAAPKVTKELPKVFNLGNLATNSLCNDQNEKDCKKMPACDWRPKTQHCQRKSGLGKLVFNEDSENVKKMRKGEEDQLKRAREEYLQSKKSSSDTVSNDTKSSESQSVAEASQSVATPKKSVRSIQRVSGESRACVQKNYNIKTKAGSQYSVDRCILSDDPNVNDTDNCMWNPPTGRCRKVSRR